MQATIFHTNLTAKYVTLQIQILCLGCIEINHLQMPRIFIAKTAICLE